MRREWPVHTGKIITTEVSQLLKSMIQLFKGGWVFNAGFASFRANPNLIGFPLYGADSKIGKLQIITIIAAQLKLRFS